MQLAAYLGRVLHQPFFSTLGGPSAVRPTASGQRRRCRLSSCMRPPEALSCPALKASGPYSSAASAACIYKFT